MAKKPSLGSGERFSQLKSKLAKKPGVSNPGALAASIGRKKYGSERFTKLGAKARHAKAMEALKRRAQGA